MAITIDSEPQEVALVEDGCFLKVTTDKYVVSAGGLAINVFVFAAPTVCNDGQVINFIYADVSILVTVKNSPDNSGYQIPSRSGYYSDVAHRTAVIDYLNKNFYLKRDFTLVGDTQVGTGAMLINFTAKFTGANYQFDQTASLHTVPGTMTSNAAGNGTTTRDNFKLVASIINEVEEGSDTWERMPEVQLTPNIDNQQAIFQLQRYLRKLVNGVDWPTLAQNTPILCKNNNRKYYVILSEYYGATPLHYNLTELTQKRVLFGGNLKAHREKNEDYLFQAQAKFMSWFGTERFLTIVQDGFLAWTNTLGTDTTVRMMVHVYYTDGTSSGNQQIFEVTVPAGATYNFPIGFTQLNLGALNVSKYPEKWLINLTRFIEGISNWGVFTQTVTAYEEPIDYLDRFVYFQNTLGGVVEVARLRGEFEKGIAVSSDEFLTDLDPNTIDGFGQIVRTDVSGIYTYQLSTGLLSKDELLPYIQLLMTKHAAIIDDNQLIEIVIEPGSFEIIRKETAVGQYEYAFNFSARRTTIERGFSI